MCSTYICLYLSICLYLKYIYIYIYIYIYDTILYYKYTQIDRQCALPGDVQLHIDGTKEPKSAQ